jgi:dTDP-4-dehydrorhamnose 3,5-epimerase
LPAGIAHGYQSLLDESHVLYVLSGEYDAEKAYSLKYDDAETNIPWPLSITRISSKDLLGLSFAEAIEKFK